MRSFTRSQRPVRENPTVMPLTNLSGWYCSEPRLALNRTVVLRYRFFLEQKNLAPSTINVRLAAVRRFAYEASDTRLLSPDLAAGIRRVKGTKRLGVRIGNWLTSTSPGTCFGNHCRTAYEANVIERFLRCSLDAAYAALNWSDSEWKISKSARNTAWLLTWLAKESTSGRFQFPRERNAPSISGSRPLASRVG